MAQRQTILIPRPLLVFQCTPVFLALKKRVEPGDEARPIPHKNICWSLLFGVVELLGI